MVLELILESVHPVIVLPLSLNVVVHKLYKDLSSALQLLFGLSAILVGKLNFIDTVLDNLVFAAPLLDFQYCFIDTLV